MQSLPGPASPRSQFQIVVMVLAMIALPAALTLHRAKVLPAQAATLRVVAALSEPPQMAQDEAHRSNVPMLNEEIAPDGQNANDDEGYWCGQDFNSNDVGYVVVAQITIAEAAPTGGSASISGTAQAGQTLIADTSGWSPTPAADC